MVGTGFAVAEGLGAAGKFASGLLSAQARQGEFAQQIRAIEFKKNQTIGIATARAAASGTTLDSLSTDKYIGALANQFDTEITNVRRAKRMTGIADLVGNISTLVGAGASIYGSLGQANNWWQPAKPTP